MILPWSLGYFMHSIVIILTRMIKHVMFSCEKTTVFNLQKITYCATFGVNNLPKMDWSVLLGIPAPSASLLQGRWDTKGGLRHDQFFRVVHWLIVMAYHLHLILQSHKDNTNPSDKDGNTTQPTSSSWICHLPEPDMNHYNCTFLFTTSRALSFRSKWLILSA